VGVSAIFADGAAKKGEGEAGNLLFPFEGNKKRRRVAWKDKPQLG